MKLAKAHSSPSIITETSPPSSKSNGNSNDGVDSGDLNARGESAVSVQRLSKLVVSEYQECFTVTDDVDNSAMSKLAEKMQLTPIHTAGANHVQGPTGGEMEPRNTFNILHALAGVVDNVALNTEKKLLSFVAEVMDLAANEDFNPRIKKVMDEFMHECDYSYNKIHRSIDWYYTLFDVLSTIICLEICVLLPPDGCYGESSETRIVSFAPGGLKCPRKVYFRLLIDRTITDCRLGDGGDNVAGVSFYIERNDLDLTTSDDGVDGHDGDDHFDDVSGTDEQSKQNNSSDRSNDESVVVMDDSFVSTAFQLLKDTNNWNELDVSDPGDKFGLPSSIARILLAFFQEKNHPMQYFTYELFLKWCTDQLDDLGDNEFYAEGSKKVFEEWLHEETRFKRSLVHSIDWYKTLLSAICVRFQIRVAIAIPPHKDWSVDSFTVINLPDWGINNMSGEEIDERNLVFRLLDQDQHLGNDCIVGVTALLVDKYQPVQNPYKKLSGSLTTDQKRGSIQLNKATSEENEEVSDVSTARSLFATPVKKKVVGKPTSLLDHGSKPSKRSSEDRLAQEYAALMKRFKLLEKEKINIVSSPATSSSMVTTEDVKGELKSGGSTSLTGMEVLGSESTAGDHGDNGGGGGAWENVDISSVTTGTSSPLKSSSSPITVEVSCPITHNKSSKQVYIIIFTEMGRRAWYLKGEHIRSILLTYWKHASSAGDTIPNWYECFSETFIKEKNYSTDNILKRRQTTSNYPVTKLTTVLMVPTGSFPIETHLRKIENSMKKLMSDAEKPAYIALKVMEQNNNTMYNRFAEGNFRNRPKKNVPFKDKNELLQDIISDFQHTWKSGFDSVTYGVPLNKYLTDFGIKEHLQSIGYTSFDDVSENERRNVFKSGTFPDWNEIIEDSIME